VPFFKNYWKELCERQLRSASVTSEAGVGGDLRSSACAVETVGGSFTLNKDATTISYGEHADELLVTTRRAPDAPPSDQVLVLVRKADYALERTSNWDTMGMRGTCSPGFKLRSKGAVEQILPQPFGDIAPRTMVPFSHILWAGTWLGNATDALNRAAAFVRVQARSRPGSVPPGALRLAEVSTQLQLMRSTVFDVATEYDRLESEGADRLSTVGFALKMNNLKIASSQLAVQIISQALGICGMAGFKNDTKFSVGRHLRDAHSAALMISNDRIYATNASLLLVHKDREE
jgi:acyl-CoA dehydrogenase